MNPRTWFGSIVLICASFLLAAVGIVRNANAIERNAAQASRANCEAINQNRELIGEVIALSLGAQIAVEDYPPELQDLVREARRRQDRFIESIQPLLAHRDCGGTR